MKQTDYYSILQVHPRATPEQLRAAYKRLALLWHPDLSAHPEANRQMQLLNEAYTVLGSEAKRAEYDRWWFAPPEPAAPVAAPADPPARPPRPVEDAPPAPPVQPTPSVAPHPPIDLEKQKARARQQRAWLINQLKLMALSILYTLVLFAWTLLTGEFTLQIVLLLLVPVLLVFVMLFRWLRRPAR